MLRRGESFLRQKWYFNIFNGCSAVFHQGQSTGTGARVTVRMPQRRCNSVARNHGLISQKFIFSACHRVKGVRVVRQPHSETVFVLKGSSSFVWGEASAPREIPGRRRRAQTSQTRCSRSAGTLRVGVFVCVWWGEREGLGRDVNGGAVNSFIINLFMSPKDC